MRASTHECRREHHEANHTKMTFQEGDISLPVDVKNSGILIALFALQLRVNKLKTVTL